MQGGAFLKGNDHALETMIQINVLNPDAEFCVIQFEYLILNLCIVLCMTHVMDYIGVSTCSFVISVWTYVL